MKYCEKCNTYYPEGTDHDCSSGVGGGGKARKVKR